LIGVVKAKHREGEYTKNTNEFIKRTAKAVNERQGEYSGDGGSTEPSSLESFTERIFWVRHGPKSVIFHRTNHSRNVSYGCLKLAPGGCIDSIENLLGLQGHASPRQVWLRFAEQAMERIEHIDLLAW